MSNDNKMTIDERYKYLRIIYPQYQEADRKGRGVLLDQMEMVTELHRKHLVRLMKDSPVRRPRQQQRGRTYGPAVDDAVRVIAESLDWICAERLVGNLRQTAEHLASYGELQVTPELLKQLDRISVSTLRRILDRIRQDEPRLPRPAPRPPNPILRQAPMLRLPWHLQEPGHFEVDLVHHGGPFPKGEYLHTIQMVDVATGWSERVAVLGRSRQAMEDGFRRILRRLPFPILELHPDNGSEFFNHHLIAFFHQTMRGVHLSRSRPYHKNDNRFVEQKNATLVRAFLGYERLDTVAQTQALNLIYNQMWLYYNFFQPVSRLREKLPTPQPDGSVRFTRRYSQSQTPFARLCAATILEPAHQASLDQRRTQVNPRSLRKKIYSALDHLFTLPNAVPGRTEDVALTLLQSLPLPERRGQPSNAIT